jgi:hypothetical protein
MARVPGASLGIYPTTVNRWNRPSSEPPKRTTVGVALDDVTLEWLIKQTHVERRSLSEILRRAIRFEQERVKALGTSPSADDFDFGRV